MRLARALGLVVATAVCAAQAVADRIVLAPGGKIVNPGDIRCEYLRRASSDRSERAWVSLGVPQDDLGLEVELSLLSSEQASSETLSLQYSVISEAFTNNLAPAVSVGVHDLPNRGAMGRSWFLSLSKTMGLSRSQEKLLGDLQLHAGYASHRLGGAYAGASVTLLGRVRVSGELLARRFNGNVRVAVAGPLSVQAAVLDGSTQYGVSLQIAK